MLSMLEKEMMTIKIAGTIQVSARIAKIALKMKLVTGLTRLILDKISGSFIAFGLVFCIVSAPP